MLKYTKFLLTYIFKNKATFIIPIVLFVLFNVSIGVEIHFYNEDNNSLIDNSLSSFDKFWPFVFLGVFLSIIIIYCFKHQEKNGADLMFLSKPVSRTEIIVGKFLATYIMLVIYSVVTTIDFIAIGYLDEVALTKNVWSPFVFGLQLGIGSLIIGSIFALVIIIFAAYFSSIATLSIGITFSAIIPIVSYVITPLGGAYYSGKTSYQIASWEVTNSEAEEEGESDITLDVNVTYLYDDNQNFDDYQSDLWYDVVAYFDIWYQWDSFFSLLQSDDGNSSEVFSYEVNPGETKKFTAKEISVGESSEVATISAGEEKYALFLSSWEVDSFLKNNDLLIILSDDENFRTTVANLGEYINEELEEDYSVEELASALEYSFNNHGVVVYDDSSGSNPHSTKEPIEWDEVIWSEATSKAPSSDGFVLYEILVENRGDNLISLDLSNNAPDTVAYAQANEVEYYASKSTTSYHLYDANQKITVLVPEDFIPTYVVAIIWSTIGVLLFGIVFVKYAKKDFK